MILENEKLINDEKNNTNATVDSSLNSTANISQVNSSNNASVNNETLTEPAKAGMGSKIEISYFTLMTQDCDLLI